MISYVSRLLIVPFLRDEKAKIRLREWIFSCWARIFVKVSGMRLRVVGDKPATPFLLVSNHLSYMDIAAFRSTVKAVFVTKGEVESWFLAGKIVGDFGNIYINRQNKRDIPRAGNDIINALKRGENVIIFIEGTTSNGAQILKFNSSFLAFAVENDLPVHYASICYKTLRGEVSASESVCWWRDETGFGTHIFNLFKMPSFSCTLTFGAKPLKSNDRKVLANELWQAVNGQFTPVE